MAGARERHEPLRRIDDHEQDGRDHPRPEGRVYNRSSCDERLLGAVALDRERAQRVAQLAHRRRRPDPVPDDIADHHRCALVVELERVVPVAADLRREAAGQVTCGELEPRVARQPLREQAALERLDQLAALAEALHVIERDRHPVSGQRQQLEIAAVEAVLAARAEHAAARAADPRRSAARPARLAIAEICSCPTGGCSGQRSRPRSSAALCSAASSPSVPWPRHHLLVRRAAGSGPPRLDSRYRLGAFSSRSRSAAESAWNSVPRSVEQLARQARRGRGA